MKKLIQAFVFFMTITLITNANSASKNNIDKYSSILKKHIECSLYYNISINIAERNNKEKELKKLRKLRKQSSNASYYFFEKSTGFKFVDETDMFVKIQMQFLSDLSNKLTKKDKTINQSAFKKLGKQCNNLKSTYNDIPKITY